MFLEDPGGVFELVAGMEFGVVALEVSPKYGEADGASGAGFLTLP